MQYRAVACLLRSCLSCSCVALWAMDSLMLQRQRDCCASSWQWGLHVSIVHAHRCPWLHPACARFLTSTHFFSQQVLPQLLTALAAPCLVTCSSPHFRCRGSGRSAGISCFSTSSATAALQQPQQQQRRCRCQGPEGTKRSCWQTSQAWARPAITGARAYSLTAARRAVHNAVSPCDGQCFHHPRY